MKKNIFFISCFLVVLTLIGVCTFKFNERDIIKYPVINSGSSLKLATEYENNTAVITATVLPTTAFDTTLTWSIRWDDDSTDDISNYVIMSISEDTHTCSLTYLKPFGSTLIVTAVSNSNSNIKDTCFLYCYKIPYNFSWESAGDYVISVGSNDYDSATFTQNNDQNLTTLTMNNFTFDMFKNNSYQFVYFNESDFKKYGTDTSYSKLANNYFITLTPEIYDILNSSTELDDLNLYNGEIEKNVTDSYTLDSLLRLEMDFDSFNNDNKIYSVLFENKSIPIFEFEIIINNYTDSAMTNFHSETHLFLRMCFDISTSQFSLVESVNINSEIYF